MQLRVSQLAVTPIFLNEHDAPVTAEQIVFAGNADGTAVEHLQKWLADLPAKMDEAAAASAALAEGD